MGHVVETDISDHCTISLSIREKYKTEQNGSSTNKRLTDQRSISYLKSMLQATNWTKVLGKSDKTAFNEFEQILTDCLDVCCPYVNTTCKKSIKEAPWITKGIKIARYTKSKLQRKARIKKDEATWNMYKTYRNCYYKVIRNAKIQHYKSQFFLNKKNIKKTWSLANELTGRHNKQVEPPTKVGGFTKNEDIANGFNDYYSSVAPNLASKIPKANKSHKHYLQGEPYWKKFKFKKVCTYEIDMIIRNMAAKRSSSFDGLSNYLLKKIHNEITEPLCHIINLSFQINYIPDSWKAAKIIPLYKAGPKDQFSNYRPVSLLSTLSKVLEKCADRQIREHLELNSILYPKQYGFRPRHNCAQLLLNLQSEIFHAKVNGRNLISLFLDLRKAFDTVSFTILYDKLEYYGIERDWFCEYLSGRKQSVSINNQISECRTITCGVPQGSVLGPTLFIIYINDFPTSINLSSYLFADDSTLTHQHADIATLYSEMNELLAQAVQWFRANKLTLHPEKTKYIIFNLGTKIPEHKLYIDGTEIERIHEEGTHQSFKLVGVMIDENLSWKHHITHTKTKILQSLRSIVTSKHFLPQKVKILLYNALVKSHLEYCITVWGGATDSLLKPLEVLQKRAIRAVCAGKYNSHTDPLFHYLEQLKLKDLYHISCAQLGHDILNELIPRSIFELFPVLTTTKDTRSSKDQNFIIPYCKSEQLIRFPQVQIAKIWNGLSPPDLKGVCRTMLVTNMKLQKLRDYETFRCNKVNCYSCRN
jgi:hypothetical protein